MIHGGDVYSFVEKYGKEPIDFSANINPLGLPQSVKEAVCGGVESVTVYPDVLCRKLGKAVSEFEGVDKNCILFGNGAADIIFRLAYALKPKAALILAPTFAEYQIALNNVGCKVQYFYLTEKDKFEITDEIISQIKGKDIVFICNPNNPTGKIAEKVLMYNIALECKKQGAILVVDECFMDFVDESYKFSLKSYLKEFNNVVILKAFTKIFAMPGLRLGYCLCSNNKILADVFNAGQPWSVSTLAQLAGVAACGEAQYVRNTVKLIARERQFLVNGLREMQINAFESNSNFILFCCKDKELYTKLLEKNIIIRKCSNYVGLNEFYYRIAVKNHSENQKLINALKSIEGV